METETKRVDKGHEQFLCDKIYPEEASGHSLGWLNMYRIREVAEKRNWKKLMKEKKK